MKDILLVGVGGALGALSRYGLGLAILRWLGPGFPWATLFINVSGCLLIGMAMGGGAGATAFLPRELKLAAVIGFLGAFTTFSTFGYETISLLQGGKPALAVGYVLASVFLGLASVGLGIWVTRGLV
jgi:CrcB protein